MTLTQRTVGQRWAPGSNSTPVISFTLVSHRNEFIIISVRSVRCYKWGNILTREAVRALTWFRGLFARLSRNTNGQRALAQTTSKQNGILALLFLNANRPYKRKIPIWKGLDTRDTKSFVALLLHIRGWQIQGSPFAFHKMAVIYRWVINTFRQTCGTYWVESRSVESPVEALT